MNSNPRPKPDQENPSELDRKATPAGALPAAGAELEPLLLRVSGNLDLHTFRPRDLPELLPAWFEECLIQGILTVRVIHGKGGGTLRQGVHTLLSRMSAAPDSLIHSWSWPAPDSAGAWGATLVHLRSAVEGSQAKPS